MNKETKQTEDVLQQLSQLSPQWGEEAKPAAHALAQLQQRIDASQQNTISARLRGFLFAPARRGMVTAVTLLLLLSISLSFPTVRAAASDFLGLFRVQKFSAISISPERLMMLQQIAESGSTPGELELLEEPGAAQTVDSLDEAMTITGVTQLRTLPSLGAAEKIMVTDGGNGRFHIDLEGARAILDATGADPMLLPDTVADQFININIFAGVEQQWADDTLFLQTESPLVEYPAELDPALLGEALLQIVGLTKSEATRLAQQIDWTSTLLLPISTDVATFNEVTIEGVSGIALLGLDNQHTALIWQKDGMIHLLLSSGNTADLLTLANTLR